MARILDDIIAVAVVGGIIVVVYDFYFNPRCAHWIPLMNNALFDAKCIQEGPLGIDDTYPSLIIDRPLFTKGQLDAEGLSDSIHDLVNKVLKGRTDTPPSAATTQKTDSTKDKEDDSNKDTGSSSKSKGSPFDFGTGAPTIIAPKKRQVNQPKGETALSRMIEQALKSGETADMEKSSTPSKGTLDEWINNAITGAFRPYPSTVAGARAQQSKAVGNDIIENFLEWYGNGVNWLGQQITQHVENVQKQNEDIFKFLGIPTSPSPMLKPLIPIPVLP